jgi:bifunctional non-homologous end joining protein LigD
MPLTSRKKTSKTHQVLLKRIDRAHHPVELPRMLAPALAQLTRQPPAGEAWLHEIKFDGYRLLARLEEGKVLLRTRQGNNWTGRFAEIATAVGRLPARTALLDGEVVSLTSAGVSSFAGLQQALSRKQTSTLVYYVFDLLHLDGWDLRQVDLEQRKAVLRDLLAGNSSSRIQYVDHVVGDANEFLSHCRGLQLEGIISKRRQSAYRSGRSGDWLKIKCVRMQPFLIGGFTSLKGKTEMRSLVLGYRDEKGRLIYAGRVGTGFNERTLATIERQLHRLAVPNCPFDRIPPREPDRVMHWVRPELIAMVRFTGWTADGVLRHPSFGGLVAESTSAVSRPARRAIRPR